MNIQTIDNLPVVIERTESEKKFYIFNALFMTPNGVGREIRRYSGTHASKAIDSASKDGFIDSFGYNIREVSA